MICDRCQLSLSVGDWPYCPHGTGGSDPVDVTWPGGKVFENLGHDPVRCDSPADLRRELKARALEPMVRHIDGSPHTRSWSAVTRETLEGARAMLERIGSTSAAPPPPQTQTYITSMTVTVTEESGRVWAPRGTFGVGSC